MAAEPKNVPWSVPHAEMADVAALRSLAAGTASEDQQKRAFAFIVNGIAGTYERTFHPEDARATDFSEGKRHVGRMMVGFSKEDPEKFKQQEPKNGGTGTGSGSRPRNGKRRNR